MKRILLAIVAVPLVSLALVGGALAPPADDARSLFAEPSLIAEPTLIAEYKWSSDTGFDEFVPGGFWIESRTDESQFVFQSDGNLVLYTESGRAVWQSRTYGRGAAKLALQSDGNIVVYRDRKSVV